MKSKKKKEIKTKGKQENGLKKWKMGWGKEEENKDIKT